MLSFFKQKTAYEMRIRDWSSDVCSSDLVDILAAEGRCRNAVGHGGLQGGAVAGNHRLSLEAVEEIGRRHVKDGEIGRASGRERECQYVAISVVAVNLKQ